jgi:hypothetical protein
MDIGETNIIRMKKALTVFRTPGGGREVAIDAMDCRRAIAEKIRDKKSHYLLAVKENRPTLYQDIGEYFEYLEEPACRDRATDQGRGDPEEYQGYR